MSDNKIKIDVETEGFEEATQKVEALADAYDRFPAQVMIKGCKDCTINIYPSQVNRICENGDLDTED